MEAIMKRRSLYFTGPEAVETREEDLGSVPGDQVLVQTLYSAISAGTEMLLYRNQIPDNFPVDTSLEVFEGAFRYPMKYGYSTVGKIVETGKSVDNALQDEFVFAFHPHESHFTVRPDELVLLPPDLAPEDALFLPNMETAVNLVMDGQPVIGEKVVVMGQGIVGLLTTALLSHYPGVVIYTVDSYQLRRNASLQLGADRIFSTETESLEELSTALDSETNSAGADLLFEVSSVPEALAQGINFTGFDGRIILGSWYGAKPAEMNFGGEFHRNRITIKSSQVSTIDSRFGARWTKSRRLQVALDRIGEMSLQSCITHRFPVEDAGEAYQLIDQHPEKTIQVILTY